MAGKAPLSGLKVTVDEAFLHCGPALIRGRIWDADEEEANRERLY